LHVHQKQARVPKKKKARKKEAFALHGAGFALESA